MVATFGCLVPEESMQSVLAPSQAPDSHTPSQSKPGEFSGGSQASYQPLLTRKSRQSGRLQTEWLFFVCPFVAPP